MLTINMKHLSLWGFWTIFLQGSVVGATRLNEIKAHPQRRAYVANVISSDNLDLQDLSKYNCAGLFFDPSGRSEETYDMEKIVVKYAYDLFIEKGSNLNRAADGLQNRLLQNVGERIFTDCDDTEALIKEITMAANDVQHPTDDCKIQAQFDVETDCYAMKGRATVYYRPSGRENQNDEAIIIDTMSEAVKATMDNSVLVTDTVIASYFIGERDSFKFRSSEYYYKEGSPGHPDSASWVERNVGLIAGVVAGLVAVIIVGICIKCHRKKKAIVLKGDLGDGITQ